ncbi:MAG TPA: metallophosphoesterase [Bacteroidia bacterium]|nr:metallophosphoesterase [Bacteroidia bacterium]
MQRETISPSLMTRREALRKTIYFSTGLMGAGLASRVHAAKPDTSFSGPGLHLLSIGDFGNARSDSQARVAARMAEFAKSLDQPLDAVLALGDNFYGKMTPDRFDRHFEKMYDIGSMPCPFHACIGNHDYEKADYGRDPEPRKCEMQLEYAKENPGSRWKMPAKWYTLELPDPANPLLKIIVLDSNLQEGALTPQEKLEQQRFLKAELEKGTKAPWLWLMMHHPPYTETTKRKDSSRLIGMIDEAVRSHFVSVCIGGHDHNLQHLQVEGCRTNFIVNGAGGANTYEVTPSERGFSRKVLGFTHFHLSEKRIKAQFIDVDGDCLHTFRCRRDGSVEVV